METDIQLSFPIIVETSNMIPNDDNILLFQWQPVDSDIHFGCIDNKGIRYWRTFKVGRRIISDKWDICSRECSWHETKPQIGRLQYLVITGEHFDIEEVIKEANRNG